ncbi:Phage head-tail joining protein [Paraburkholderia tropica]|uniref:head-tail adaptor protein n=1 Tax=Paraburkholderia tropica TaxID=92647 RepID=UPI001CB38BCD|nr:head-tail adaptor protein [Paraburkholderia tropica]CAG9195867.1 Phage head-tail joining protein [Paraburkholderia tropica]
MSAKPGRMRDRITLRVRTDAPTLDMGVEAGYSAQVDRWAEVTPVGAVAYAASVQADARVTHRMRMRLFDEITTQYEVVWNGWVYRVRRAKHEHAKRETTLEVEEQHRGE